MIKFKTIKTLKPSEKVLKIINSARPICLSVTNGEIKFLEPINIQTIIPIKYIITYSDRKLFFLFFSHFFLTSTIFIFWFSTGLLMNLTDIA